jgi:hypothetical protein
MKIQLSYESSPGTLMATDRIHPFWEARVVTEAGGPISMVQAGRGSTPEEAIGSLILGLKDGPLVTVEIPVKLGTRVEIHDKPPDATAMLRLACPICGGPKSLTSYGIYHCPQCEPCR